MATWKIKMPATGDDPALVERTHAAGENGLYQASEKLAKKIYQNGPEYYSGGRKKAAARSRAMSRVAFSMADVDPDRYQQAFGHL